MTKHISLRIEDGDLHARLVAAAAIAHRSLNSQIVWCLEQQLPVPDDPSHHPARPSSLDNPANLELREHPS